MTDLYGEATRQARREFLRLVDVKLSIATEEQIAKGRLSNEDFNPRPQMVITWEPVSYRKEGGKYGNVETDYLVMSYGDGYSAEEIAEFRTGFWRAMPRRLSIPTVLANAKRPWELQMFRGKTAGLRLAIDDDGSKTGTAGQVYSPDAGSIFEVEAGMQTLPTWDPDKGKQGAWTNPAKGEEGKTVYMRLPIHKADDYVIPDEVPVIHVRAADDDDAPTAAPVTTTGTVSGVTAEKIYAAFVEAGLIGTDVNAISTPQAQMALANKFGRTAPVFLTGELLGAATNGKLIELAESKGAITVVDGVIQGA